MLAKYGELKAAMESTLARVEDVPVDIRWLQLGAHPHPATQASVPDRLLTRLDTRQEHGPQVTQMSDCITQSHSVLNALNQIS